MKYLIFMNINKNSEFSKALQDVGLVLRKVNGAIYRIEIFQLPQKGIKSNDTGDNKLTRDK